MSDALRRLQDMLAGWANFKDKEAEGLLSTNEGNVPTEQNILDANYAIIEGDMVSDLYQDAGNITANDPVYDENEPSSERVKAFVLEKILPLILKGFQK
jgi:hypothetical protein